MLVTTGRGRPLLVELAFETLEPRGEIAVGGWPRSGPALVPRIVAVHGEPRACRVQSRLWTPPEAAETLGPGLRGVKNKAGSAKMLSVMGNQGPRRLGSDRGPGPGAGGRESLLT